MLYSSTRPWQKRGRRCCACCVATRRPGDGADGQTRRSDTAPTTGVDRPAPLLRRLPTGVRARPQERLRRCQAAGADLGRLSRGSRKALSRGGYRNRRAPVRGAPDAETDCRSGTFTPSSCSVIPGLTWGVRPSERTLSLPCDSICPRAGVQADRAISIAAPPPIVFSWLCQLRVAPYSYDALDNLGRRSPRERNPELVHLEVGQRFMTVFGLRSFVDGEQVTFRSKGVACHLPGPT